jgi:putative sigma-54 modulation protein
MQIDLRTPSIEPTDTLRAYVTERVWAALGRFAPTIERVVVTLDDLNGPRGGVDKRCTARVLQVGAEPLVVAHTHEQLEGAVAQAARRAGRALARRRNRAARGGTWGRREALRTTP